MPDKANAFKAALMAELRHRYEQHWDVSNNNRGSGYRAITFDSLRTDPALLCAAVAAQIEPEKLSEAFKRVVDHTMFVNPGEVKVRNGALLTTSSTVLWPEGGTDSELSQSMSQMSISAPTHSHSYSSTVSTPSKHFPHNAHQAPSWTPSHHHSHSGHYQYPHPYSEEFEPRHSHRTPRK